MAITGMIKGTGSYVPPRIVENTELTDFLTTSDAWIRERTGIRTRHVVTADTVASMAAKAAEAALLDAGISAREIDLILVSTTSPGQIIPSTACLVQEMLGCENTACFDMNAACSGFVMAYQTACAYIESGMCRKILVIGSEALSNVTDWEDRSSCILFGDGAGAVVLTAEEGDRMHPVCGADGTLGKALILQSSFTENRFMEHAERQEKASCVQMDGQAIFRFAVRKVPQVIEVLLQKNALQKEEITYYILHQANERIVQAVARRLQEPVDKFPMNLQKYGNTSSASVPVLLDELHKGGNLKAGDKLVLAGFGGGLTWAATVADWR